MGRKGVSKRKPKQTTSKPQSSSDYSNTVSSALRSAEIPLVKSLDTGKAIHRKQNSKKG